ncbi:ABC transporter substrate-binding protein [Vibrio harveyi]|uniref:ABC transporter substrate-binding protein n=1 Tax=Vibrio harveyi TaxID=669 RepID=UPI002F429DB1
MKKLCFALPLIFSAVSFANEPVQRVISLAPHATEIAYAAGLGDKLIAVSEMSDYPEQAKDLEKVSNYQGIKLEQDFRAQLEALKEKYNTEDKVSYFYQLSEKPIITVAGKNWPSEVFTFCGGENIFAKGSAPYPQVSIEQVITRQPEVLFTSRHAMSNDGMWAEWKSDIPALKNGHVWSLNSDWINRPTPRTLNAITEVCEHFESVRQKR